MPREVARWLREEVAREIHEILADPPPQMPTHTAPENGALLVWVATHTIDATLDDLYFTDGEHDGKVDIFHSTETEDTLVLNVYQVAAPALRTLAQGRLPAARTKVSDDAREFREIVAGRINRDRLNSTAQEVHALIQRAIEESGEDAGRRALIRVHPIALRTLAEDRVAEYRRLQAEAASMWSSPQVRWDLRDIVTADDLHRASRQVADGPAEFDLTLGIAGTPASANPNKGPHLCFVRAFAVVEAYRKHRSTLFDGNLRYSLGNKTKVNKTIAGELSTPTGIRRFHEKNNGLVVTCKVFRKHRDGLSVVVHNPQVVNGAQTVTTIYERYIELQRTPEAARADDQRQCLQALKEDLLIPVKFVQETDPERADKVAIASNTQNPLSARTLRSTHLEIRTLKKELSTLPQPWFLESKDGEWEALRSERDLLKSKTGGKTHRDFQIPSSIEPRRKYRVLSNSDLALALLSMYGFLEEAKPSRIFQDKHVRRAFGMRVKDACWRDLTEGRQSWNDETFARNFEVLRPAPSQCILAHALYRYWDEYTYNLSRQLMMAFDQKADKEPSFKQYLETDDEWNVPEEAAQKLLEESDCCYWVERVARSMYKVLVFESAALLVRRYGALTDRRCTQILELPHFAELAAGATPSVVGDFRGRSVADGGLVALGRIIHLACALLWSKHEGEIRNIQSPQQVLLQKKWTERLRHQVAEVWRGASNVRFRTAHELDPTDRATAIGDVSLFFGELASAE